MGIVVAEDNDDLGDGLPTMGEEAEAELRKSEPLRWTCNCGEPDRPGILHRADGPCYVPDPRKMYTP